MGRFNNGHHHLKLPDHLYLSPPSTPPPHTATGLASSFFSVKTVYQNSSTTLLQETQSGARAVGNKIPGFKTSAAFLATLRANLNIEIESTPASGTSTPDCLRPITMTSSMTSLPPPSPSPLAQVSDAEDITETNPSSPLEDVPPLTTAPVTSEDDKVEALHLIADSVAQQRQFASRAIMFHPLTSAIEVLFLGLIYQYLYKGAHSDWAIIGTTFAGVTMSTLITIRFLTKGYIEEAEAVGTWKWLDAGRTDSHDIVGDADDVLLSKYGNEAIGALVLRGVRESSTNGCGSSSPRKRRQGSSSKNAPVTGKIRGWAVKNRVRRKGVGTELLEEAVRVCQQRGWQGPEFDKEHANNKMLIPQMFWGRFKHREVWTRAALEKVKDSLGVNVANGGGRRRR